MGCSICKKDKQKLVGIKYLSPSSAMTTDRQTCNVFNQQLGKVVKVPILVPASESLISKKRKGKIKFIRNEQ